MEDFLKSYQLNKLTQSIAFDLSVASYVAGCKALGLVCKIISTPFWNLLEDKNINILEMDEHYVRLKSGLRDAAENVPEFMQGKVRPFGDSVRVKEDMVYDSLIEPSQYDTDCELFLSVILGALSKYVEQKFKDFLPGGLYSRPSDEQKSKAESVEKHNKFSERVFAYYDNLLRFKPHIQTLASEAYVAFTINKTGEWLNEKSSGEIKRLVSKARKEVHSLRLTFKRRKDIIMQRRREKLEENMRRKEADEARKLQQQEEITEQVIYYGLWQTEEQVDAVLSTIPTKAEKIKALKVQLKFRKEILKQTTDDNTVYKYSREVGGRRVQLSVAELSVNVKKLLRHARALPVESCGQDNPVLVGRRVRHKFTADGEDHWYIGKVISQVCEVLSRPIN